MNNTSNSIAKEGILLIASQENEWILPWWKINYLVKNTLPVAFIDAGMSQKARKWCQNIASVIDQKGSFAELLLASPFEKTVYVEPYVQIRIDLAQLLEHLHPGIELMVPCDQNQALCKNVFAFQKTERVKQWLMDQIPDHKMLSHSSVELLPEVYNWPFEERGENLFAALLDRRGKNSEKLIRDQIRFFDEKLYIKVALFE